MRFIILAVTVFAVTGCTAWKVRAVQDTVHGSSQCPAQLQVSELEDGWRVEGCEKSWFCGGVNGPCEQRSCEAWENASYNKCIEHASRGGATWGAQLAHAMMADSLIQECRINHDRALQQCGLAPASPTPTHASTAGGASRM